VLLTSATEGDGVGDLWATVEALHRRLRDTSELETWRSEQRRRGLWGELTDRLLERVRADPDLHELISALEEDVASGETSVASAVERILAAAGNRG
jgi:LAO/AO transport system kinase